MEILLEEKIEIDGKPYFVGHTKEYVKGVIPYKEGKKGSFAVGTGHSMITDEIVLLDTEA